MDCDACEATSSDSRSADATATSSSPCCNEGVGGESEEVISKTRRVNVSHQANGNGESLVPVFNDVTGAYLPRGR